MHLKVGTQHHLIGYPAVLQSFATHLIAELGEVDFRSLVADCNINLALSKDEVRNLVVLTSLQSGFLQEIPGVDVVNVGSIEQQVENRYVAAQKSLVIEQDLRCLISVKQRAISRRCLELLRQKVLPVRIRHFSIDG